MAQRPSSIDEFATKVKELYASDPAKVRFVLKYKHHEGTMTLRATNDELVRASPPRPPARAAPRARRRAPPSDPRGRSRRRNPRAQWLIYKTDQAAEFRRLEALQLWLMAAMCGSDVEALTAESEAQAAAEAEAAAQRRDGGKKRKGKKR